MSLRRFAIEGFIECLLKCLERSNVDLQMRTTLIDYLQLGSGEAFPHVWYFGLHALEMEELSFRMASQYTRHVHKPAIIIEAVVA